MKLKDLDFLERFFKEKKLQNKKMFKSISLTDKNVREILFSIKRNIFFLDLWEKIQMPEKENKYQSSIRDHK